jgi:ParB-like chromosome segregation protein Spo0J
MSKIVEIALSDIALSTAPNRQIRPVIPDHVRHLADETDHTQWQPIDVRPWPESDPYPPGEEDRPWQVVSGYHRTSAARALGLPTIRAQEVDAPDDATFTLMALKGNTRHGLLMSNEEIRAQVRRLRDLGVSEGDIHRATGISKGTLHNWLTGRDTNAARPVRTHQPDGDTLPDAGWVGTPSIDLDAHRRAEIECAINKALATDASGDLTPAEARAWVASLTPTARRQMADQVEALALFWTRLLGALQADLAEGQVG